MLAFTEEDTELHEQTVAAEEQEIDVIDLIQPTDKEMPLEKGNLLEIYSPVLYLPTLQPLFTRALALTFL